MPNGLLDQIEGLIQEGYFVKALEELETIKDLEKLLPEEILLYLLLQSTLYRKIGHYNQSQVIAEQLLLESQKESNVLREIDAINELILSVTVLEQYSKGLELIANVIPKFQNLSSKDNQTLWQTREFGS